MILFLALFGAIGGIMVLGFYGIIGLVIIRENPTGRWITNLLGWLWVISGFAYLLFR